MNIVWKGSPNKNDSSYRKPIDKILIHWFGIGTLDSANTRFQNDASDVSAHYGISDDVVYQWVKEEDVAWHAGVWEVNQESIGIEHDATTIKNASEQTYQTAGELLRDICNRHNIPLDREHILKHSEVSATQCPGTLDVDKIIAIAKGESMSLTEDIGTSVEDEFKLKEIERYNKYWSYNELIADWVRMYGELMYNINEKDRYKDEARASREQIDKLAQTIADLNTDIQEQDSKLAEYRNEITIVRETISTLTKDYIEIKDKNIALEQGIERLTKENKDLYEKIAMTDPLKQYRFKDLFSELIDRLFKRG